MNRDVGHMKTNAFHPKHHLSIADHSPHLEVLPLDADAVWLELGRNREKGHGERKRWGDIETERGEGERQWKHPFEQMTLILFKALAAQPQGPSSPGSTGWHPERWHWSCGMMAHTQCNFFFF